MRWIAVLIMLIAAPSALADDQIRGRTYYFGTHEARTNVTFVSEADLETIHGVTHRMQGQVRVDAEGKKATGSLRIGVRTLNTGIPLRNQHLQSSDWLHADRFPFVELALVSATPTKDGKKWSYTAKLKIKGASRDLKGTARIRPIPDAVGSALGPGSWIRVRTAFDVRLSDFGIRIPQQVGSKVSEVWKVNIDIYGTTQRPRSRRAR